MMQYRKRRLRGERRGRAVAPQAGVISGMLASSGRARLIANSHASKTPTGCHPRSPQIRGSEPRNISLRRCRARSLRE
eukprot:5179798-Pyramimonas_sp.AAC.2